MTVIEEQTSGGLDLASLAQLNEAIIQHLDAGVVVLDDSLRIRMMNDAAWSLLGRPDHKSNLLDVSADLADELSRWRANRNYTPTAVKISDGKEVIPRFTPLGASGTRGVLLLLEDTALLKQQAQHIKLHALGRLTASIAHEIRNPLGAISHASQLLQESDQLDQADRRLSTIIHEQAKRMNAIIENVMQLGRRDKAVPERLCLREWLDEFVEEFARNHKIAPSKIQINIQSDDIVVSMDPSHLHQVLYNLCQNALTHGDPISDKVSVQLRGGHLAGTQEAYLDVIDSGPGIDEEMINQIFEPFFTTDSKGTGLGLYIAQELCEVNQAKIDYIARAEGGSCFRIRFRTMNYSGFR